MITPIRWEGDRLLLLDQTLLPGEERMREYTRWPDVAEAIRLADEFAPDRIDPGAPVDWPGFPNAADRTVRRRRHRPTP